MQSAIGIAGLISAAVAVVAFVPIAGFAGQYSWRLDLASHFRAQYFVFLAFAALALFAMHARRSAMFAAAAALLNLAFIVPLYVGHARPDHASVPSLGAMLINVNTVNTEHAAVVDLIRKHDPDFVVLEEVDTRR